MSQILVLNGPNLNLLGLREVQHYGVSTLDEIEQRLTILAAELGHDLYFIQHNHEGALIDLIHEAFRHHIDFIIFNPGAYTHSSIALRDALLAVQIPFIELHLSNIYQRDSFRHHSYFSDIAQGQICGFGAHGYELAMLAAHQYLCASEMFTPSEHDAPRAAPATAPSQAQSEIVPEAAEIPENKPTCDDDSAALQKEEAPEDIHLCLDETEPWNVQPEESEEEEDDNFGNTFTDADVEEDEEEDDDNDDEDDRETLIIAIAPDDEAAPSPPQDVAYNSETTTRHSHRRFYRRGPKHFKNHRHPRKPFRYD